MKTIIIAAALLLSATGCSQLSNLKVYPKDEILYLLKKLEPKDEATQNNK